MIDTVTNGFSPSLVIIHLYIFDHSIIAHEKIVSGFGFSNTSHVDSLDRFRKSVIYKVKIEIIILMKRKHLKGDKMKIKHENEFIKNVVLGDPTTCIYQFI